MAKVLESLLNHFDFALVDWCVEACCGAGDGGRGTGEGGGVAVGTLAIENRLSKTYIV